MYIDYVSVYPWCCLTCWYQNTLLLLYTDIHMLIYTIYLYNETKFAECVSAVNSYSYQLFKWAVFTLFLICLVVVVIIIIVVVVIVVIVIILVIIIVIVIVIVIISSSTSSSSFFSVLLLSSLSSPLSLPLTQFLLSKYTFVQVFLTLYVCLCWQRDVCVYTLYFCFLYLLQFLIYSF